MAHCEHGCGLLLTCIYFRGAAWRYITTLAPERTHIANRGGTHGKCKHGPIQGPNQRALAAFAEAAEIIVRYVGLATVTIRTVLVLLGHAQC